MQGVGANIARVARSEQRAVFVWIVVWSAWLPFGAAASNGSAAPYGQGESRVCAAQERSRSPHACC
eukprot:5013217-Lingulodinium_polyedra.AAC.1